MTEITSSATCVHRLVQLRALERFGARTHISKRFASTLRSSVSLVVLTAATSFAGRKNPLRHTVSRPSPSP